MIRYSGYLIKNILKKWVTWAIIAAGVLAIFLLIYVQINELKKYSLRFVDQVNMYTKMIPFIFGISFISMIIVYVFKDGEDDGTELLIISKPIRRTQILLGKFFVVFLFIIFFQIITFITIISVLQYDTYSTGQERVKLALSFFVGGIIISIIASFIVMFIASFLGKIGTISIGIATAALIPIVSSVVVVAGKGATVKPFNVNLFLLNQKEVDEALKETAIDYIKTHKANIKLNKFLAIDRRHTQIFTENQMPEYEKYKSTSWYEYASYVDLWYQWGSFYDVLSDKKNPVSGVPIKWSVEKEIMHISDDEAMAVSKDTGKNIATTVNTLTAVNVEPQRIINALEDILLKDKGAKIYVNQETKDATIDAANPKGLGASYSDIYDIQSNNKSLANIKPIKILDTFTKTLSNGKTYSFEDRIRAVHSVHHGPYFIDAGLAYISVEDLIVYKILISALKSVPGSSEKARIVATLNSYIDGDTSLTPAVKAQLRQKVINISNSIGRYHYLQPQSAHGFKDEKKFNTYIDKEHADGKITDSEWKKTKSWFNTYNLSIIEDGEEKLVAKFEDYIPKNNLFLIWSILGGLILFITVFRYFRRDFK